MARLVRWWREWWGQFDADPQVIHKVLLENWM